MTVTGSAGWSPVRPRPSRVRRALAPVLLGLVGAVVGLVAGLALHWSVVQPSDDDLRAAARTLTPAEFTRAHEPVVTGAWAPSLDRGVVRWDATSLGFATLGTLADGLRDAGWAVDEDAVDASALEGEVDAVRGDLVVSVSLSPMLPDRPTTVVVTVGRGPQATALRVLVAGGVVAGASLGAGGVLAARRWRGALGSGR
ncbi:hypothetical protein [Cellulomonas hominis]|uniref:hypothetical protein n=1 Tax=Cellulomonas hominis TaxID=156981 RepID=UPI001443EF30|nr:hypothetical protein [Cellulomonas hominis]NKY08900.1 hypothetical protein [Cellulomonas hominis]